MCLFDLDIQIEVRGFRFGPKSTADERSAAAHELPFQLDDAGAFGELIADVIKMQLAFAQKYAVWRLDRSLGARDLVRNVVNRFGLATMWLCHDDR